jgi:CRISPR type III-A-associated protein Csm2
MPIHNRPNRDENRNTNNIDELAAPYIPVIKRMLELESASTDEIKSGVNMTETLVKKHRNITTHQVRNIYSLITDLKTKPNPLKELQLLRPKLAYIGARQKENDGKVIIKVIDAIIQSINTSQENIKEKIDNLAYIMECIVAYQKFYSKN